MYLNAQTDTIRTVLTLGTSSVAVVLLAATSAAMKIPAQSVILVGILTLSMEVQKNSV